MPRSQFDLKAYWDEVRTQKDLKRHAILKLRVRPGWVKSLRLCWPHPKQNVFTKAHVLLCLKHKTVQSGEQIERDHVDRRAFLQCLRDAYYNHIHENNNPVTGRLEPGAGWTWGFCDDEDLDCYCECMDNDYWDHWFYNF